MVFLWGNGFQNDTFGVGHLPDIKPTILDFTISRNIKNKFLSFANDQLSHIVIVITETKYTKRKLPQ